VLVAHAELTEAVDAHRQRLTRAEHCRARIKIK
jgi:hypothetical protein